MAEDEDLVAWAKWNAKPGGKMTTLEHALLERKELRDRIEKLDKVIAFLSNEGPMDDKKGGRKPRKSNPDRSAKMRASWARRKAKKEEEANGSSALS